MSEPRITSTRVDRVGALSAADRRAMFALFERYYDSVTWERFATDLSGKQHVVRLFDSEGGLRGFSTIQLIDTEHAGRPMLTIFSGDTVVDRACWGQKGLQRAFTGFLIRTRLAHPRTRIFWFLISKGFKTYLLMRNNLTSYPNYREPTPPDVKALLDRAAALKYPRNYDAASGLIRFPECVGAVKRPYAQVTTGDLENPDIRFFVKTNPGYAKGDELCCLAELRTAELVGCLLKYGLVRPVARAAAWAYAHLAPRSSQPVPARASAGVGAAEGAVRSE